MASRQVAILFWKAMCQRRRRCLVTIMEIASGAVIFSTVFLVRYYVLYGKSADSNTLAEYNEIGGLYYTPNNIWTNNLISMVTSKIESNSDNKIKGINYQAFNSREELTDYIYRTNLTNSAYIIIMDNVTKLPYNLTYELYVSRNREQSLYNSMHLFYDEITPRSMDKELPNVLKIQWALNEAFMDMSFNRTFTREYPNDLEVIPLSLQVDKAWATIYNFLVIFSVMAPMPSYILTTARLVDEKQRGLHALLKLLGVSRNVMRHAHLLEITCIGFIYSFIIAVLLKISSQPILPYSSSIIVGLTLFFHFVNSGSVAFIMSSICQDHQHSVGISLLIYLLTYVSNKAWYSTTTMGYFTHVYLIGCVLPHAPLFLFWQEVFELERLGTGATFATVWFKYSSFHVPICVSWLFFIIHLLFVQFIAWYLEIVRPGRYGVAENWKFIFTRKFWRQQKRKKKKKVAFHVTAERIIQRDDRFFEAYDGHPEEAIKVVNIKKVFASRDRKVVALHHVNLDVYKGEITVLLGPNGAGKTTLLSIITGMYSSTNGIVYVNGIDMSARMQELCKDLGLCPQHNLTFRFLTVQENIMFFAMLKGSTISEAIEHSKKLMTKLRINQKADSFSYQLSTGRKRCLQVACALAGGADVLVLDEPTSGMDQESKHAFWDILLVLRGQKSILMSTTCMDEADALGDRIAILHDGILRCYGTPMFLKQAIGAGLTLTLMFKQLPKRDKLAPFFEDITNVKMKMVDQKHLTVTLPTADVALFPAVFDRLEEKRRELGILSMSIGMSMDDLYMKFIEDDDEAPEGAMVRSDIVLHETMISGCELLFQQYSSLVLRNVKLVYKKKLQFLIMQVLVPILGIIYLTLMSNSYYGTNNLVSFNALSDIIDTVVYNFGGDETDLRHLRTEPKDVYLYADDVEEEILRIMSEDVNHDAQSVIGLELTDNQTRVFYSDQNIILAPIAVNLLSNAIISKYMPNNSYGISMLNTEDGVLEIEEKNIYPAKKSVWKAYIWILGISFVVIVPIAPTIWTSVQELAHGTRYRHIVAGTPPILHWMAKYTTDLVAYVIIVLPTAGMCCKFLEFDDVIDENEFIVAFMVALILYGAAFHTYMYMLSFFLSASEATGHVYIAAIVIGVICRIVVDMIPGNHYYFDVVMMIHPTFVFTETYRLLVGCALQNSACNLNRPACPSQLVSNMCCDTRPGANIKNYFQETTFSLVILGVHIVFYFFLVIMLQDRKFAICMNRVVNFRYRKPRWLKPIRDTLVRAETAYVKEKMILLHDRKAAVEEKENVMVVENLHKKYRSFRPRTKTCYAVKGLDFTVKAGECLTLLGEAGAGKTTILNVLAGYTVATRGKFFANGYFLEKDRYKYLHMISYAMQSGGLDEFSTGYENLTLLAKLKGYNAETADREAMYWIDYMGLSKYGGINVGLYSAGSARRLAAAGALMGIAKVVLLDEPLESVDPSIRPLITRALRRAVDKDVSVVVAVQSVGWKEIDMMAKRIIMLSDGQLAAIGTVEQIRENYGSGYTMQIKLRVAKAMKTISKINVAEGTAEEFDLDNVQSDRVREFKTQFETEFAYSTLIGEHLSMLYYHIDDEEDETKLPYSVMFQRMEELKNNFPALIEDYILTETTVNDVLKDLADRLGRQYSIYQV